MQFERQGYFVRDTDSTPDRPVFNRTIGLRDTFAKEVGEGLEASLAAERASPTAAPFTPGRACSALKLDLQSHP